MALVIVAWCPENSMNRSETRPADSIVAFGRRLPLSHLIRIVINNFGKNQASYWYLHNNFLRVATYSGVPFSDCQPCRCYPPKEAISHESKHMTTTKFTHYNPIISLRQTIMVKLTRSRGRSASAADNSNKLFVDIYGSPSTS